MRERAALVTGFEPYGGRGLNPSAEVARALDGTEIESVPIVGGVLPVSFRPLRHRIRDLLREVEPLAIVSLGLWPGESAIRLERFALNLADFEIPDNSGDLMHDAALDATSAVAIPSRLPLRAIEEALLEAGIPAYLSNSAGTFLCNATMYTFLQESDALRRDTPCGFVHLPYVPEQVADLLRRAKEERHLEIYQRADRASMSLAVMVEAVRIILATTLEVGNRPRA